MRQNTFEKNKQREMLVEQIIEFEWKGYGPSGHKRSQGGPTNPPQLKCYL